MLLAEYYGGLDGEKLFPAYRKLELMGQLPNAIRPIISRLLKLLGQVSTFFFFFLEGA